MTAHHQSGVAPAIFFAGLLSGGLDLAAAILTFAPKGVRPIRILQGIACGLLGPASFHGGWKTAALGAFCHFLIAFAAAAVFVLASRHVAFLTRQAAISGALYGVAVYLIMYWMVLPLSRARSGPFSWSSTLLAIATHIVCVGIPISLVTRHFSR